MASGYKDPLENMLYPDRVNYANGVLLDENDFKAEQTYFRGRMSRALSYLHGFGTVAGLNVLTLESEPHILRIMPGLAVDRLGRLIELHVPYCIRVQNWLESQNENALKEAWKDPPEDDSNLSEESDTPDEGDAEREGNENHKIVVADLFIKFNTCERGKTPCFGVGNVDATDAFTAERLRDGVGFDLILRTHPEDPLTRQQAPYETYEIHKDIENDREGENGGNDSMSLEEAMKKLRSIKVESGWRESNFWNPETNTIKAGAEYSPNQNGTEVLLARIRLPVTGTPVTYDTSGSRSITIENDIRVLSLSVDELFWLIKTTRGV